MKSIQCPHCGGEVPAGGSILVFLVSTLIVAAASFLAAAMGAYWLFGPDQNPGTDPAFARVTAFFYGGVGSAVCSAVWVGGFLLLLIVRKLS